MTIKVFLVLWDSNNSTRPSCSKGLGLVLGPVPISGIWQDVSHGHGKGAEGWRSSPGWEWRVGLSTVPALRHRSPRPWFPSLGVSALPHKEQPPLGVARWLLVTQPPPQAGDRALGVPSSGPTGLGQQQRDGNVSRARGLCPEVTHSCENWGRNLKGVAEL